jgi:hypothetical protein
MTVTDYSLPLKLLLAAEALGALAQARFILHRTAPGDVLDRNRHAENVAAARKGATGDEAAKSACARIAWVIPRLAARLPWRSDCLVQALAGQQMLRRRRIASAIAVGTAKHADGTFEAHAWLMRGECVILGGDISRFEPLLQPGPLSPGGK